MQFQRESQAMKQLTTLLRDAGKKFTVRHGTYTTTLETDAGKRKFMTHNFAERVFIAAKMIRRDVLQSEVAAQIMNSQHSKMNFGHREEIKPFSEKEVLNIDISSAYATTLWLSGMITEPTFNYLQSLRKEERLPAIGMLAKSAVVFNYEDGKCKEINVSRQDTHQIFFYLIEEVNLVMQSIAWELGRHYYFHWVDGVFFSRQTPRNLVGRVEEILADRGYRFKYENVTDFQLKRNRHGLYTISMNKNGEHKVYQFHQTNNGNEIKKFLMLAAQGK